MPATVRDLMHRGVITCAREASLSDIALLLVRERVHAVFVAGDDGEPVGLVTDFDLLAGEWLGADEDRLRAMRAMTAGDLMSAPPETIDADATAREAAGRLRSRHIGRLLVVERGRAIGVIAVSDLVTGLARQHARPRTVDTVMSRALVVCRPDVPIEAAARAMAERRSRSIVVIDHDATVIGVVTGHDLLALYEQHYEGVTVRDLMTSELQTITPDASLREAADLMLQHEVHRLVVLDGDGPPSGLVSTADIAAAMAEPESVWR